MKDVKTIPNYILELIKAKDKERYPTHSAQSRRYSYLQKRGNELVQITVAVKERNKKWFCKPFLIQSVHYKYSFVKDLHFAPVSGYRVSWNAEKLTSSYYTYAYDWDTPYNKNLFVYAPIVNLDVVGSFEQYKYSGYQYYKQMNILNYIRLYEQYPVIEYFAKMGFHYEYVTSIQLLKKATADKKFRKYLAKYRDQLQWHTYHVPTVIKAYNKNVTPADLAAYQAAKLAMKGFKYKEYVERTFGDHEKFIEYVNAQKTTLNTYADYIEACQALNLNRNDSKVFKPHDFKYWHDVRINEYNTYKIELDAKERKAVYEKFAMIAEKYMSMQHNKRAAFICIIAKSPAELIAEGKKLHHCVGKMGYDQKFLSEQSLIFFIRAKDAPDVPLATIEYSPATHRILQCRGDHNVNPGEDVMNYVNKTWLPYANKQLKQIAA